MTEKQIIVHYVEHLDEYRDESVIKLIYTILRRYFLRINKD